MPLASLHTESSAPQSSEARKRKSRTDIDWIGGQVYGAFPNHVKENIRHGPTHPQSTTAAET